MFNFVVANDLTCYWLRQSHSRTGVELPGFHQIIEVYISATRRIPKSDFQILLDLTKKQWCAIFKPTVDRHIMAQLTYSNYSPTAVDIKIFCARPKVVNHVGLATPTEKENFRHRYMAWCKSKCALGYFGISRPKRKFSLPWVWEFLTYRKRFHVYQT
jgi:hypothetical protein